MGLLRTCNMHWRRVLPSLQPLVFSFLEARKTMLSRGEQETSRAKVCKGWVGLDRTRTASAGVTGIGVGEREKGCRRLFGLLNWGGLRGWGLQRFGASQKQPSFSIHYGVRGKIGLNVKGLGTAVVMDWCCAASFLDWHIRGCAFCFCSYLSLTTSTQLCSSTCANVWKQLCEWLFL